MIPRFLLAVATMLLLTACAKDAAAPAAPVEDEANTAAIELHFHAIEGLNPGANGQAAPVRVRIF
jgi:type VI secretion system protein VasD